MTDLQLYDDNKPTALSSLDPKQQVERAGEMAAILSDIIEKQKLYTNLGTKKHVNVEGWQTLGSFLGIRKVEREVVRNEDGSFTAYVELVNRLGDVIASSSHTCGDKTDGQWAKRPEYARRSMAITRATGKAYRDNFAWIMTMAGYSPTPLEEMDHVEPVCYEGTEKQKAALFKYIKETHPEEDVNAMKEIHQYLIDNSIVFSDMNHAVSNYINERTL